MTKVDSKHSFYQNSFSSHGASDDDDVHRARVRVAADCGEFRKRSPDLPPRSPAKAFSSSTSPSCSFRQTQQNSMKDCDCGARRNKHGAGWPDEGCCSERRPFTRADEEVKVGMAMGLGRGETRRHWASELARHTTMARSRTNAPQRSLHAAADITQQHISKVVGERVSGALGTEMKKRLKRLFPASDEPTTSSTHQQSENSSLKRFIAFWFCLGQPNIT